MTDIIQLTKEEMNEAIFNWAYKRDWEHIFTWDKDSDELLHELNEYFSAHAEVLESVDHGIDGYIDYLRIDDPELGRKFGMDMGSEEGE